MGKYYKIGYIWDNYLDKVTPEDMRMLTHINIAFGLVENGKIKISHLKNTDYIKKLREYNPEIKILLSVGGWGAGGFSKAASTLDGCIKFAQSGYDAYTALGLDGIDIDWEYPCSDAAKIDASPDDKYNFTLMMQKLREALPNSAMLTIAAGAGQYFIDGTEMEKVEKYLDYVQLMTYDMCGDGAITVHHTNLFESSKSDNSSAAHAVDIFNKAGVPSDKLIIGAAFYSREWRNISAPDTEKLPGLSGLSGLYQSVGVYAQFGAKFADLCENYINKNGYTRYWDDVAKAPYLFNGSHFITYDDEESIAHKCEYIKQKGVKGIMYWEHSCDETRCLLNAIDKNL